MKRLGHLRLERLRSLMELEGLESFLVTRREDIRYLTGFTGTAGSLLVSDGKPCLITDFRYKVQAHVETKGITILIQKKDIYTALKDAADSLRVKTLWFDASALTIEGLKKLNKQGLALKGHRDLVRGLRQRKDKQELSSILLAIQRAEEAFRELMRFIKPGATEQELGLKLEFLMRENGARKTAFDTIVASGGNGAMPHASVTSRRIKKGDLVTFDFGAEANGYFSDITRTHCVGRPSAKQVEVHAIVLQAQAAAIQSIRVGARCKSVDDAARETIRRAGHGSHFGHGTGHGIGLMVHEGPSLSPQSDDRIELDMVFTVEPGVYIPGWGGVRTEDMVVVTPRGAQMMTTLSIELEFP